MDDHRHRNTKGKEKVIEIVDSSEEAADGIDIGNNELEWQDYNPVTFGPDVVPDISASADAGASIGLQDKVSTSADAGPSIGLPNTSASAGSSIGSGSYTISTSANGVASTSTSGDQQPVLDDSDTVMANLLSSHRSFSDLNIESYDNPYSASADFGFDF